MLRLLDQVITRLLDQEWGNAPAKPDFAFAVPDDGWQQRVRQGTGERLNIYLYEVRENREFRRPGWEAGPGPDRSVVYSLPPAYFDCHYLLSAWSATEETDATTPTLDEHAILSEALRVLLRNPVVTPAALGVTGGSPVFEQAEIGLTLAAPESARVVHDFWTTMKLAWRPAIPLVATAPLDLLQDSPPAPRMTTFIERYAPVAGGDAGEHIQIGGWVLHNDRPLAGATVTLVATGAAVQTDAQGQFVLAGLRRGTQTVRVTAAGRPPVQRDLDIPTGSPDTHVFRL